MEKHKKLPRVLIDARMVRAALDGIAAYVVGLARGLRETKHGLEIIFLVHDKSDVDPFFEGFEIVTAQAPFLSPRGWLEIPKLLREHKIDLYHTPSFDSLISCPIPYVQTIHDLNHLTYGGPHQKIYYLAVLKRFAANAEGLFTVSHTMARALGKWLRTDASNIKVVPNSFWQEESSPKSDFLEEWGLKKGKYLLCLTNEKPHKNNSFLIQSYLRSSREHPLVLSVSPSRQPSHPKIKYVGKISQQEIRSVLQGASALLSPSKYEGFGRPPLEALLLRVPTVVSEIEVHRELLAPFEGRGAVLLPFSQEKWIEKLSEIQQGPCVPVPAEVSEEIQKRYSPHIIAEQQIAHYRKALSLD